MKKVFFAFVAASVVILTACNNKPAETETTTETTTEATTEATTDSAAATTAPTEAAAADTTAAPAQ
jgi:ABC-type enterochelin transport system substrate-binding protein